MQIQTRREFLTATTATLIFVPIASAGCGSTSSPQEGAASCEGVQTTSSVALSHTHTVCVASSDLTNPSAGGATYTTSGPDPTHTVTLTKANLQRSRAG